MTDLKRINTFCTETSKLGPKAAELLKNIENPRTKEFMYNAAIYAANKQELKLAGKVTDEPYGLYILRSLAIIKAYIEMPSKHFSLYGDTCTENQQCMSGCCKNGFCTVNSCVLYFGYNREILNDLFNSSLDKQSLSRIAQKMTGKLEKSIRVKKEMKLLNSILAAAKKGYKKGYDPYRYVNTVGGWVESENYQLIDENFQRSDDDITMDAINEGIKIYGKTYSPPMIIPKNFTSDMVQKEYQYSLVGLEEISSYPSVNLLVTADKRAYVISEALNTWIGGLETLDSESSRVKPQYFKDPFTRSDPMRPEDVIHILQKAVQNHPTTPKTEEVIVSNRETVMTSPLRLFLNNQELIFDIYNVIKRLDNLFLYYGTVVGRDDEYVWNKRDLIGGEMIRSLGAKYNIQHVYHRLYSDIRSDNNAPQAFISCFMVMFIRQKGFYLQNTSDDEYNDEGQPIYNAKWVAGDKHCDSWNWKDPCRMCVSEPVIFPRY